MYKCIFFYDASMPAVVMIIQVMKKKQYFTYACFTSCRHIINIAVSQAKVVFCIRLTLVWLYKHSQIRPIPQGSTVALHSTKQEEREGKKRPALHKLN